MDARLSYLLGSYTEAHALYTLARLEFALHHSGKAPPTVVGYCVEGSEDALRAHWSLVEAQLDAALGYALRRERGRRRRQSSDRTLRALTAALRDLERSSRAVRWALTIAESNYDL